MTNEATLPPLVGGAPKQAVLLLHGLGDSGAGLIDLGAAWREGLPEAVFVAPDAPYPCDMAPFGYQWFSLLDRSGPAILAGVKAAAPIVKDHIERLAATYALPYDKIALVGFSQGTMMSLYVAPRLAQSLAGVLGYSGALIGGETLKAERRANPPIMLAHGTADEVVPFVAMQHARDGLENANLNVTTLARPGLGHSIDDVGLAEGLRFLRQTLIG